MKHNPLVVCLLIICITILTFTLLTRQTLYELRFRDGDKEVAALMACNYSLTPSWCAIATIWQSAFISYAPNRLVSGEGRHL